MKAVNTKVDFRPLKKSEEGNLYEIKVQIPMHIGWIEDVKLILEFDNNQREINMTYFDKDDTNAYFKTETFIETNAIYHYYFTFKANGQYMSLKNNEKFKLSVNFDVPDWAKGKVMYHIFLDRFNRGSQTKLKPMPKRHIHTSWNEEMQIGPDNEGIWNNDFYGGDLKGIENKSISRKLSTLRSFYKYLCEKVYLVDVNPTANLESIKTKKSLPKYLTLNESIELLNSIDGSHKERDYCIITLFLNCGLRVSELAALNLGDVNDEFIRILGKGNKERIVYLNKACKDAIDNYLTVRIKPNASSANALFISQKGNRINVQTVKWLVKKHLQAAGLGGKNMSVHKLRHTAATLMYQNGVDVRALQEVLGHENLDTTKIYTHVTNENLKDAARKNPLSEIEIGKNNKKQ